MDARCAEKEAALSEQAEAKPPRRKTALRGGMRVMRQHMDGANAPTWMLVQARPRHMAHNHHEPQTARSPDHPLTRGGKRAKWKGTQGQQADKRCTSRDSEPQHARGQATALRLKTVALNG